MHEQDTDVLVIGGATVDALLTGNETAMLEAVSAAYQAHRLEQSSLPHSLFLRFPDQPKNRIIALPAYLGGSAKRTAASAVLAAQTLHTTAATHVGIIGCGVISFEIARFVVAALPQVEHFVVFDLYASRAQLFGERVQGLAPDRGLTFEVAPDVTTLLERAPMVFIATTALKPYLAELTGTTPDSTILHVSLRDLTSEVILASDNLVDDIDHVMRAQTSVHLAEEAVGHRDFIRGTLADVLSGAIPPRLGDRPVVFSPFGLGILDLALGKIVVDRARESGQGTRVPDFLPDSWERSMT